VDIQFVGRAREGLGKVGVGVGEIARCKPRDPWRVNLHVVTAAFRLTTAGWPQRLAIERWDSTGPRAIAGGVGIGE
jgi:hypothetical protein